MTDLQAEIDAEADRIRVFFRCWQRQHNRLSFNLEDFTVDLAEHQVRNRAVVLQNDTRVLVEAARYTIESFNQEQLSHYPQTNQAIGDLLDAVAPFETAPNDDTGQDVPPWTNYTPSSGIHETSR